MGRILKLKAEKVVEKYHIVERDLLEQSVDVPKPGYYFFLFKQKTACIIKYGIIRKSFKLIIKQ